MVREAGVFIHGRRQQTAFLSPLPKAEAVLPVSSVSVPHFYGRVSSWLGWSCRRHPADAAGRGCPGALRGFSRRLLARPARRATLQRAWPALGHALRRTCANALEKTRGDETLVTGQAGWCRDGLAHDNSTQVPPARELQTSATASTLPKGNLESWFELGETHRGAVWSRRRRQTPSAAARLPPGPLLRGSTLIQ